MKWQAFTLTLAFATQQVFALSNYANIYPPVMQKLTATSWFIGDRHDEFFGDDVAILSDGSAWKIHPDSIDTYRTWGAGDDIRVSIRTDHYWFKREHKFLLNNHTRGESAKAMLVQHKQPNTLYITYVEAYAKSSRPVYHSVPSVYSDGRGNTSMSTTQYFAGYEPTDWRKIIFLSDGSSWVIKDNLNEVHTGMKVYVGAQGVPGRFYDFVLICGDEREAFWTLARPHK